jgi:hypothetical protein
MGARRHRKWSFKVRTEVASANLSTQTNGFVQSEAVPALGEESVHEVLGEVFGEHGELCNVQIRVGGPLEVILREL